MLLEDDSRLGETRKWESSHSEIHATGKNPCPRGPGLFRIEREIECVATPLLDLNLERGLRVVLGRDHFLGPVSRLGTPTCSGLVRSSRFAAA